MMFRNTNICAVIVLLVALLPIVMMVANFTAVPEPDLKGGYAWLAVLVAWIAYVALTSFYKLPPDKMLASFMIGTLQQTYVAGGRYAGGGERGLFGLDIVILLYPLWHGVYFPTTIVKLIHHATRVYLKEYRNRQKEILSPSVPVRVDITILLRLSTRLGDFVRTINVLSRGMRDLAHETEIHDNLWRADDENNGRYLFSSPRIAQLILDTVNETVLHSVRSIASQYYVWKEIAGEGGGDIPRDIKGSIPHFRGWVLHDLAKTESVFCQAGILQPSPAIGKDEAFPPDVVLGSAVLSFDLRVEDVMPEDEQFLQALSEPMIADLRADADKAKGRGEGERLRRKSEISGVPADEVFRGEVLENVDNVNVYGAGESITDLIRAFFGRGRNQ